jgi:cytochrome c oxidase assembly protein subunit 15
MTRLAGAWGRFARANAARSALVTASLTLLLVLVGEFTAAAGAGATCNFTYPGCAGQLSPVGLTIPQFVEWFHRFFAMLVGFVIVGNALVLWGAYGRSRIAAAGALAAVLLPFQVFLGGVTVTFASLFPAGYTPAVQLGHLGTALALFLALVAALVWIGQREGFGVRLHTLGYLGLGLTGFQALLAPGLVFVFWPGIQTGYHLLAHLAAAAFLATMLRARALGTVDGGIAGGLGLGTSLANTFLVIGIFLITDGVRTVVWILLFVQLVAFGWIAWIGRS